MSSTNIKSDSYLAIVLSFCLLDMKSSNLVRPEASFSFCYSGVSFNKPLTLSSKSIYSLSSYNIWSDSSDFSMFSLCKVLSTLIISVVVSRLSSVWVFVCTYSIRTWSLLRYCSISISFIIVICFYFSCSISSLLSFKMT